MRLSTVIITRNQRWNVERIIASVQHATAWLGGDTEIVLVDSASSDGTPQAATAMGVTALVLSPEQRLTAAAGRFVGFENTSGDAVLFLDGDMAMTSDWLKPALETLADHDDIAGVVGGRIDLPLDADTADADVPPLPDTPSYEDVPHGGGAAIYRRSVLDEVGSFNPFVYSDEEPELCIRIRYGHGSRIVKLNHPIVLHFTDPPADLTTLVRRAGRNLFVGQGQNIRLLLRTPLLGPYVRERGRGLAPIAWTAVGVGTLVASIAATNPVPVAAWAGLTALGAAALAARQRSLKRAGHRLLQRALMGVGTVKGFAMKPKTAADYPALFERLTP